MALLALAGPAVAAEPKPAAGAAREARKSFAIPAQPLANALNAFGRQAGLQVSVDAALTAGAQTQGVSGEMTNDEALARLLAGTGISWRYSDDGTVILSKSSAGGAIPLDPVRVSAPRENANSTLGAPPAEYAGGQVARGGQLGLLGNRDMLDAPFSITSYTVKTIEDQQARSIGDVLVNDPSVRANWPRGSYADNFMIRGFNLSNPNVALGGIYGILPLDRVPLEMAERIEVLKGPSALLSGINPGGLVGGNINVVPKRAEDQPIARLTASYVSDAQPGVHLDLGGRFGADNALGVRFNGVFRSGDTKIDNQKEEAAIATFGIDYRGEAFRLSLDAGYQKQRVDDPLRPVFVAAGLAVPAPPEPGTNFFPTWTFVDQQDTYGALRAEYDVMSDVTAFAAVGGRQFRSDNLLGDPTITTAQGAFTASPLVFPLDQDSLAGQVGVRGRFHTGPVGHSVSLIGDILRREFYNSFTSFPAIGSNIYNPQFGAMPNIYAASNDRPRTSLSENASLAFADTLSLWDDRVQLTAGGRYQQVKVDNFNVATGAVASSYDESAITPAVGLVVKPWRFVSLYANYIEGLTQGPTAPATASNRGQIFPPAQSTQIEAGVKLDHRGFGATLSLFQITQPSGITDPTTRVFGVDGEQRNRGIELSTFGEVTAGLRVLGGIALLDGVLTKTAGGLTDGKTAPGVPDVQVNIGAEWDVPVVAGLTLAARTLYTSGQVLNAANTQSIPDWTRVDLGLRYRLETREVPIVFRASVENVFNERYWASTGGGYLTIGAPRTFLISTSFDF